jgi:hypothetical protein
MMLVYLLRLYVPDFVKKQKLNELFRLTSEAFGCEPVDIAPLSYKQALAQYALTTKERAGMYIGSGRSVEELKCRLYLNAYAWGKGLRKMLLILSWKQAKIAMKELYRLIDIELCYNRHGEIIIKRCYFSNYYSVDICHLISALDAGLAAGLSGGGTLRFDQRITEGHACCKGMFER